MRALSHGCVRVEDPERLAELVLDWPESRVGAAIGGSERTVFLPRPLPIHIEYFTEFVDEAGDPAGEAGHLWPDAKGRRHIVCSQSRLN